LYIEEKVPLKFPKTIIQNIRMIRTRRSKKTRRVPIEEIANFDEDPEFRAILFDIIRVLESIPEAA